MNVQENVAKILALKDSIMLVKSDQIEERDVSLTKVIRTHENVYDLCLSAHGNAYGFKDNSLYAIGTESKIAEFAIPDARSGKDTSTEKIHLSENTAYIYHVSETALKVYAAPIKQQTKKKTAGKHAAQTRKKQQASSTEANVFQLDAEHPAFFFAEDVLYVGRKGSVIAHNLDTLEESVFVDLGPNSEITTICATKNYVVAGLASTLLISVSTETKSIGRTAWHSSGLKSIVHLEADIVVSGSEQRTYLMTNLATLANSFVCVSKIADPEVCATETGQLVLASKEIAEVVEISGKTSSLFYFTAQAKKQIEIDVPEEESKGYVPFLNRPSEEYLGRFLQYKNRVISGYLTYLKNTAIFLDKSKSIYLTIDEPGEIEDVQYSSPYIALLLKTPALSPKSSKTQPAKTFSVSVTIMRIEKTRIASRTFTSKEMGIENAFSTIKQFEWDSSAHTAVLTLLHSEQENTPEQKRKKYTISEDFRIEEACQ